MKIFSADPGETTGVVIDDDGELSFWQIDCRQISAFWFFLCGAAPDKIMYEQFHYRPNLMKAKLYSVQVIAVLRLYAELNNVPIVFTPIPSEAKKFWDDTKIAKLGLWKPGARFEHAMDALRVLLKYRLDTDPAWFAEVLPKLKD